MLTSGAHTARSEARPPTPVDELGTSDLISKSRMGASQADPNLTPADWSQNDRQPMWLIGVVSLLIAMLAILALVAMDTWPQQVLADVVRYRVARAAGATVTPTEPTGGPSCVGGLRVVQESRRRIDRSLMY